MASRHIPHVDMLHISKSLQVQRKPLLKFVPSGGLACINYRSLGEVDTFYLDCQKHRDYYRDPVGKMHKPLLFEHLQGKCGSRPDRSIAHLLAPDCRRTEPQPVVFPERLNRQMILNGDINITAHYSKNSTTVFKR